MRAEPAAATTTKASHPNTHVGRIGYDRSYRAIGASLPTSARAAEAVASPSGDSAARQKQ